jgi:hypothetical protein
MSLEIKEARNMKRFLALALVAMMALATVAMAQGYTKEEPKKEEAKKEEAKPVTLTGEVLDLYCYMDHKATGPEHAKCASSCITKGLPTGFLSSDGVVYLLIGKDHEPVNAMVAAFAGKKSTVTGVVKEQGGVKGLELLTIADAK